MFREPQREDNATPATRISWMRDAIWGGSVRRMAQELGLSASLVSKLVAGEQQPGAQFLRGVAAKTPISLNWLLTGDGYVTGGGDHSLPVAERLLPGSPLDYRSLLSDRFASIEAALYRPTRYWLALSKRFQLLQESTLGLCEGDLLLLETDVAWMGQVARKPDDLDGRILEVAVWHESGPEHRLMQAEVRPAKRELLLRDSGGEEVIAEACHMLCPLRAAGCSTRIPDHDNLEGLLLTRNARTGHSPGSMDDGCVVCIVGVGVLLRRNLC